jgi:DNA-binding MurR/RpiR family transcriptional regulator
MKPKTNKASSAPKTREALIAAIAQSFDDLSKQLKALGHFMESHGNRIGLMGIQEIASACQVQPSAVVRFAKHFGYKGFSEMQQVFKEDLQRAIGAAGNSYQARVRKAMESDRHPLSIVQVAHTHIGGSIEGLKGLQEKLDDKQLTKAVELLQKSHTIWLAGNRRSFAIAVYLNYALQHTDKGVQLVSGLGHMSHDQLNGLRPGDVMIAVSFAPYAEETLASTQLAERKGAKIIAITDSRMSPIARAANAVLITEESQSLGFRSLTNAMALAQSLFIALAYANEMSSLHKPPTTK